MHDMMCSTARRWLQEPESLSPLEARHLDRHLMECLDCTQYRRQQVELDRRIVGGLAGLAADSSVRQDVRARLAAMQGPDAKSRSRSSGHTPFTVIRRHFPVKSLALVGAVAVAATLLAMFAPRLTSRTPTVQTANAGWHAVRPRIGYPLTVDPSRPNHLLAGALGGVFESWNAGATWTQLRSFPRHFSIRDLAIHARQPNRYLVATLNSVLLSDDAGRHWRVVASGLQGAEIIFLMEDPYRPNVFYLGPSILWHSVDGGETWTRDGGGSVFSPYGIQALTALSNGDLYTGIWGHGVALSHDGGVRWTSRTQGLDTHVMSVTARPDGKLWAATSNGVYRSMDAGLHWQRSSPPGHLFTTGIFDGGSYLLAGGNGGLYRSTDGGRHWTLANTGLPIDPYIFGFIADPFHHNRVYASLDSDGPYRSDDGGRHWISVSAGLPLLGNDSGTHYVLFRRGGVLWKTDSYGTDPGSLTVDTDVHIAAMSGDGGSAAYVAGKPGSWAVRAICAGGCAARTLATGSGDMPRRIFYSPTGDLLAAATPSSVVVVNMSAQARTWPLQATERVLGWAQDGRTLLTWIGASGTVQRRSWTTGAVAGKSPLPFPARPLPAPNGKGIAMIDHGTLFTGVWGSALRPVARLAPDCKLSAWSDDSTRLLLSCGAAVQVWTGRGKLKAGTYLPNGSGSTPRIQWAPHSDRTVLFFRGGSLWRWTQGTAARTIVPAAQSVAGRG